MNHNSIRGGYSLLTATQLSKIVAALSNKQISFYAFRAFFACLEMKEQRKAFYTSQKKQRVKGRYAQYTKSEITSLLGARSKRHVSGAIKALERENILTFNERIVHFSSEGHTEAIRLLENCNLGRTPHRKIIVPRRISRYLARCPRASVAKTLVLYLLRGVSFKSERHIQAKGTMKSSLLAELLGISIRAVKAARRTLISLGIITPDETRSQRKLNRTGAFFTICLNWNPPKAATDKELSKTDQTLDQKLIQQCTQTDPELTLPKCTNPAPPPAQKCTNPAPPIERHKTSNEGRNQKLCTHTSNSGVSKNTQSKPPSLSNVVPQDLEKIPRLEKLYHQAVQRNILKQTESTWLAFVAAAVRAKKQGRHGEGVKLFMAIVRRQLYHHITQDEEDEAQRLIKAHHSTPKGAISGLLEKITATLTKTTHW